MGFLTPNPTYELFCYQRLYFRKVCSYAFQSSFTSLPNMLQPKLEMQAADIQPITTENFLNNIKYISPIQSE